MLSRDALVSRFDDRLEATGILLFRRSQSHCFFYTLRLHQHRELVPGDVTRRELDAVASRTLGVVEFVIGVAVELGERRRRHKGDAADADRQRVQDAFGPELRKPDCPADAFGDDRSVFRIDVRQEDAELLAAQPRDEIGAADIRLDRLCDEAKSVIAALVAEAIVDDLEVVNVEQQQGAVDAVALDLGKVTVDQRGEGAAVETVRQHVGRGRRHQLAVSKRQLAQLPQQEKEKRRSDYQRYDQIVEPPGAQLPETGLERIAVDGEREANADGGAEHGQHVNPELARRG